MQRIGWRQKLALRYVGAANSINNIMDLVVFFFTALIDLINDYYVLLLTPFLYFYFQVLCFHTRSIFSLPFHSLEVDFSIIFHCMKKWFLSVRCIFSCNLISITDLTMVFFFTCILWFVLIGFGHWI